MAPNKTAKKAAKKTAKKAAKKSASHHDGRDLRRAYEHTGRLEALSSNLSGEFVAEVQSLLQFAQACLQDGEYKSAADLLRAGEHLAFGSLAPNGKEHGISAALAEAIREECEDLTERAHHHRAQHDAKFPAALSEMFHVSLDRAEAAFRMGAFRRALEFARTAEALSHVHGVKLRLKEASDTPKKLKR